VLTGKAMTGDDMYRMMKRRLKDFDLPQLYSPHSFRVTTLTDLFRSGRPGQGHTKSRGARRCAHDRALRPDETEDQQEYCREDFSIR
jgi:hypothetical protein